MKKITLSVTAALLMGASAFAVETDISNVKIEGKAGLYYGTDDQDAKGSLFDQNSSIADAFLSLKLTADINKKVKAGIAGTSVSTLGLENNLVGGTYTGSHPVLADNNASVKDFTVMTEAWFSADLGKTNLKLGRQELDTPLVFGETWGVVANTYDATVLTNKSIEDVTLLAAFIGRGNGAYGGGPLAVGGEYTTFGADSNATNNRGAYAFAAVYEKDGLKVQAWAYSVTAQADAVWAEVEKAPDTGLIYGAQYTAISSKEANSTTDSDAVAAKIGYAKEDAYKLTVAYSQTGKDGSAAYNIGGGSQSKLYTEAWWNYGYITRADTSAVNITAEYDISKTLSTGFYVTQTDRKTVGTTEDLTEATLSLTKKYDDFEASLVYIYTDAEDQNVVNGKAEAYNGIQIYLTAEF